MINRQLLRGALSAALVVLAAGCAGAPVADQRLDADAKRFDPPPGNSGAVYVYRTGVMGVARPIEVNVAGGSGAALAYNNYIRLEGPPGPITLSCRIGDKQSDQQILIEPGRTRYVEVSMKVGLMLPDCQIAEVSPDQGQSAVRGARRVLQN